jgi:hypothetical protein
LRPVVEEFYVAGLEYARMKALGIRLVDGAAHYVPADEREEQAEALLRSLAHSALANLALASAYPGENAAMTPRERSERRSRRQLAGEHED